MARVCRGTLVIITHGKPANRSPTFRMGIDECGEWEE